MAKKVAVVRLEGVIASGKLSLKSVERLIDKAYKMKPEMVALVINSPGGSPAQSSLIHDYIREKRVSSKIPTISFVEDIAASGGYFIALAGDKIFANPFSIVGSVGVVSGGFGFPQALGKLGVERRVYHSGTNKVRLDPFSPTKSEDIEWLLGLQKSIHGQFINHVVTRRASHGVEIGADKHDELFNGDVWVGQQAVEKGLIDGVATVGSYVSAQYGSRAKVVTLKERRGLMARLLPGMMASVVAELEEKMLMMSFGL
jgi:serine protease SohB